MCGFCVNACVILIPFLTQHTNKMVNKSTAKSTVLLFVFQAKVLYVDWIISNLSFRHLEESSWEGGHKRSLLWQMAAEEAPLDGFKTVKPIVYCQLTF